VNDVTFSTAKACSVGSGATADEQKKESSRSQRAKIAVSQTGSLATLNDIFSTAKGHNVVSGATGYEEKKTVVAVNEPRLQSFELGAW
jgi:hypothetical protein